MSDIKQTVTRTNEKGIDDAGVSMQKDTKWVHAEAGTDGKVTAQNIVWYLLGFIEVVLTIRFVLKLLGANTTSTFVNLAYTVTAVLTAPFDSIFGVTSSTAGTTHSIFEPSIVVAALVYALIAWGIVRLITINKKP